jgi:hypothetical protein
MPRNESSYPAKWFGIGKSELEVGVGLKPTPKILSSTCEGLSSDNALISHRRLSLLELHQKPINQGVIRLPKALE